MSRFQNDNEIVSEDFKPRVAVIEPDLRTREFIESTLSEDFDLSTYSDPGEFLDDLDDKNRFDAVVSEVYGPIYQGDLSLSQLEDGSYQLSYEPKDEKEVLANFGFEEEFEEIKEEFNVGIVTAWDVVEPQPNLRYKPCLGDDMADYIDRELLE